MPKAAPPLVTFDSGEFSPLLAGRVDLAKYQNACSVLENFLPRVQGPAERRGGTRYVMPVKTSTNRTWLLRFQVSETISYMLEFGDHYVRFYTNRAQLVDGGVPVEVATPYALADLTDADGLCQLRFVQSADTMYLFHRSYQTQKLLRVTATSFSLQAVDFKGGPFQDINPDESINVQASGQTGSITLTASSGIFQSGYIGTLFHIESQDLSAVKPWATHQEVSVGDFRRVDYRVYLCTAVGADTYTEGSPVTGTDTPTHTEGSAWDGDGVDIHNDALGPIGVCWEYQHSSYGTVRITGVPSGTSATADVVDMLPAELVSGTSNRWALPMFSSVAGWPEHGAFWYERLVLARDRQIAMSVVGDFENFAAKNPDEATSDSAITETLNAKKINRVVWMAESDSLVLGTNGDEWVIGPIQSNQAVGPDNIRADTRTANGSRAIEPVQIGERLLFVQKAGRKLRDYVYDYSTDSYVSTDTTKLSSHITKSGIISLAYQQEPDSIVWAALANGNLVGMTYDREVERSDVYGWHRQPMVNGIVECVQAMPAPDGASDDLWMIVRRTINGQTLRYIEYLNPPLADDQDQTEAFYVDCGLTYSGSPATTISGLDHLEGQTVDILTDGAAHPQRVVTAGSVSLQLAASTVHVGLPAPCRLDTMSIEAGSANGTSQGKTKRISSVVLRLLRSLGGKLGPPDSDNPEELQFRRPSNLMDAPPPLFTGDTDSVLWPDGYETQAVISYTNDQPLPVTLLAIFPIIETQDDR